jgi:hypothetical protein
MEGLKLNHSNFSLLWSASFSLTYFDIIFLFDLLSESVIPNRLTIMRSLTYKMPISYLDMALK